MSTLKVNNLQAESGTTISLASGHKLTGAAGSMAAPGQIIQMKRVAVNTVTTTTSNTFSNHMSAQFDNTPTVGNLVIVSVTVTAYRDPAANWGSHCAVYIGSEGMSSGDTSIIPAGSCLLYTSPSPRDQRGSRMPSSA